MKKTAGRILKSDTVKLEGSFRLDIEQPAPTPANQKSSASTVPQACVAENHPEFAIIEITCSCGTKTHVKCDYTDAQTATQKTDK